MLSSLVYCIPVCCSITAWRPVALHRAESHDLLTKASMQSLNNSLFLIGGFFPSCPTCIVHSATFTFALEVLVPRRGAAKPLLVLKQGPSQKRSSWRKQSRPPAFPAELLDVTPSQGTTVMPVVWQHLKIRVWWTGVIIANHRGIWWALLWEKGSYGKNEWLGQTWVVFPPAVKCGKALNLCFLGKLLRQPVPPWSRGKQGTCPAFLFRAKLTWGT